MSELFEDEVRDVPLAPGAMVLGGFARRFEGPLVAALQRVVELAPFRHMITPGGHRMSIAMTNCGLAGWVTDRTGYRYDGGDPESGRPWPPMPDVFARPGWSGGRAAGFDGFVPDACLVNRYEPGARLSLHQDKNERDFEDADRVGLRSACRPSSCSGGRVEPTRRAAYDWLTAMWWSGEVPPDFAITASCRSRRAATP